MMRKLLLVVLALGINSCGGKDSPTDPTQVPTAIALSPATVVLSGPGDTTLVVATVTDASGAVIASPSLSWNSENQTVATVNGFGLVTAVGSGSTRVVVSTGNQGVSWSVTVSVGRAALAGPSGGLLSLADGLAALEVPAGALDAAVFVSAEPASGLPAQPASIAGTAFDFGPDGLAFNQPATLTIAYDPADVLPGVPEAELRLHRLGGDGWQEVPSGTVDITNHFVSGPINGFSVYAAVRVMSVSTESLPDAVEGSEFGPVGLEVEGGTGSNSWTVVGGQLPDGMVLSPDGILSGTPVAAGTYEFTVEVTSGGQKALRALPVNVRPLASYVLEESGGTSVVAEDGSTDDFTIVLGVEPVSDVTFDITPGDLTEVSASPATVTFSPTDWNTPKTVLVTGVDDDLVDGDVTSAISVVISDWGQDARFSLLQPGEVLVTTGDDDVAGVTVTESPPTAAPSEVTEGGGTDDFSLVLDAQPSDPVVLTISSSDVGEVTASPAVVVFTAVNWDTPVVVTLTGIDDSQNDGDQSSIVTVAIDDANSDPQFSSLADIDVLVRTVDDDMVGFSITESGGSTSVAESGTSDGFTVVLDSEPSANVILDVTSDDPAEVTAAPSSLTFTPGNWSVAQTITVTGVDELIDDGDQAINIWLAVNAASDDSFDGLAPDSVVVTNTDDDTAGFVVIETGGTTIVTEGGGTDDFDIVLLSEPVDDVVVTVFVSDASEVAVAPNPVTFTSANWNVAQTFTVTGVDDAIVDGDQASLIAVGISDALSDAAYDPLPDQVVQVTTIDDDGLGTKTWVGGDGVAANAWENPANWTPAGVPSAGDTVQIPSTPNQPLVASNATVASLMLAPGAALDLGGFSVRVNGDLDAGQTITNGSIVIAGTGTVLQGTVDDLEVVAGRTLSGPLNATGDVLVSGTLAIGGTTLAVAGNLTTQGASGRLDMRNAADLVDVEGDVVFDGATEAGWLIDGQILVGGNFTVNSTNHPTSFVGSSNHRVVFDGVTAQTVTFTNPSASQQRFHHVDFLNNSGVTTVLSDAVATGDFFVDADATLDASTVTVSVGASFNISGGTSLSEVVAIGDWTSVSSSIPANLTVNSGFNVPNSFTVAGDLVTNSTLTIGTFTLSVTGDLSTLGASGRLSMAFPGTVDIDGDVLFDGATEAGWLVDGQILVGGNFTVNSTNHPTSFVGSSNHRVVFDGDGLTTQVVSLANPGITQQRFQDLTLTFPADVSLSTNAVVMGTFDVDDVVTTLRRTAQSTSVLDVRGTMNVLEMTVVGVPIRLQTTVAGPSHLLQNVDFQGMDPADVQLYLELPGLGVNSPLNMSNMVFDSPSFTTGAHLQTVRASGSDSFVTELFNPSPSVGGATILQGANTLVIWPSGPASPGITTVESGGSTVVSESGTTDDFTVVLAAQPATDVVLTITSGDLGEVTVDSPSLTFTNTNWNVPQPVVATGVDDVVADGDQLTSVTISVDDVNSDDAYDPVPDQIVSVTTTDDDAPLVDAGQSMVAVNQGTMFADGVDVTIVTVTARDAVGNPVPGVNVTLAVTGSGNVVSQPPGATDASGVVTGSFTTMTAEAKTVSATAGGTLVAQQPMVTALAAPTVLQDGVPVTGLSGSPGDSVYYVFTVPPSTPRLEVTMSGGSGDADLYVRQGGLPTTTVYDCRPFATTDETCAFANPVSGEWFVMLHAFTAYSGISLVATTACTLNSLPDTDADRLPDCVETNTGTFVGVLNTGTSPVTFDTDGDAISDGDEVLGTLNGLDLPSFGVSPLIPSILIEHDWLDDGGHSHRPTATQIAMITASFAAQGVEVIHDYGQGPAPFDRGNFIVDADGWTDALGSEYYSQKAANFDANRSGYFRYNLNVHQFNVAGNSGLGEIVGDDFITATFNWFANDLAVAGTIQHELGHNLGLLHGGNVSTPRKPNYNSVMNYNYQFVGVDTDCTPVENGLLDYSSGINPPLDETNLNEPLGICGGPPGWDWNQDADALDVGVVADINRDWNPVGTGDGMFEVLSDFNDWANLNFIGINDANGIPFLMTLRQSSDVAICAPPPAELRVGN